MQFETSDSARLLCSDDVSDGFATSLLQPVGFDDWRAALGRLRGFCRDEDERTAFAAALPSLLYALTDAATPDASLVNFERYMQAVPSRIDLFNYLAANPRAVEILVRLFVGSQFLTEILLRNPSYLERLTQHKRLAEFKHRQELMEEARRWAADESTFGEKMNAVRRFQKWELLRLAACDTFRLMDLKTVTLQLALLADSLVAVCLDFAADDLDVDPAEFAVIAFGKLGGEELNYSSDIDLVFVCERRAEQYWGLGQKLIKAIQDPTSDGFLYRVDMRLRPWGRSGPLVTTADSYVEYIRKNGRLWEKQALLKSRVIAGSQKLGKRVLKRLEPFIYDVDPEDVRENILEMKQQIEEGLRKHRDGWGQVKAGAGSIRDVEFVTQYLQLAHGRNNRAVRSINTLDGLVRLADLDILHADEYRHLSGGYVFLRTIEHSLQLMHNKQQHALPESRRELDYLARRLDFPGATEFVSHYERHCRSIRRIFEKYIIAPPGAEEDHLVFKPRTVAVHLGDAASTYEELFSREQAERHLMLLDRLDEETITRIDARPVADGRWELTIVGYDQLGDLSLMCGLLFVYGFDIESGYVFTGADVAEPGRNKPSRNRRQVVGKSPRRRKYVNVFTVRPTADNVVPAIWERYEKDLAELLSLTQQGKHRDASGRLAKWVAASLDPSEEDAATNMLLPVEIDINNEAAPDATVMNIYAEDTPGFLYELASALAHSNISIVRMQ
ncbi:MAG: glutamine synthetase adenylyltransferase, partial [Maioricimonas sp. JB049]